MERTFICPSSAWYCQSASQRGHAKFLLPSPVYSPILDNTWHWWMTFLNYASLMSVKLSRVFFFSSFYSFVEVKSIYIKLHKKYKIQCFDICILVWNYRYSQDNECVCHTPIFLFFHNLFLLLLSPPSLTSTDIIHTSHRAQEPDTNILPFPSSWPLCVVCAQTFDFYVCSNPHNTLLWFLDCQLSFKIIRNKKKKAVFIGCLIPV